MEKFAFENYRDNLANELKDARKKDDTSVSQEKLEKEKQSKNYRTAKILKKINFMF
jgi:hypothetical protein